MHRNIFEGFSSVWGVLSCLNKYNFLLAGLLPDRHALKLNLVQGWGGFLLNGTRWDLTLALLSLSGIRAEGPLSSTALA